jgi:hypothetical protein
MHLYFDHTTTRIASACSGAFMHMPHVLEPFVLRAADWYAYAYAYTCACSLNKVQTAFAQHMHCHNLTAAPPHTVFAGIQLVVSQFSLESTTCSITQFSLESNLSFTVFAGTTGRVAEVQRRASTWEDVAFDHLPLKCYPSGSAEEVSAEKPHAQAATDSTSLPLIHGEWEAVEVFRESCTSVVGTCPILSQHSLPLLYPA